MIARLLLPILIFIAPVAASAAPDLDDVSAYLNETDTLEARFTQYNADGSVSTGTFYLRRPGRMRMEYDEGSNGGLVLVSGGSVAIFDERGRSGPERYPLRMTPLGPILARNVDLSLADEVVGEHVHDDEISVFAQDPDHPERGIAKFTFAGDPLSLRTWTMVNGTGETVNVVFDETVRRGHELSNILFSIYFETERRRR